MVLLLVSAGSEHSQKENQEEAFRNVVFIVSDDHHPEVIGTAGNSLIKTPNLDLLASEGMFFTNGYANSPICSASRQSMMTGKYPHSTRVNLLFTPFPDHGNVTIAEYLKDKGFKTALVGKNHFNNWVFNELYKEGAYPDHGWDHMIDKAEHQAYLKENPPKKIPDHIRTRASVQAYEGAAWRKNADMLPEPYYDKDSQGTFLANWAADFISKNKNDRFCLWVAFHEPHAPFNFPVEYAGKYDPNDVPLPQGSPEDDRWIPLQFKDLTEQQRRGIIASYYTSVEYMDKNVGIVLDALRDNGLEENTLVIFNGDQGYLLNEHKRFEKHTFWDESITSPLIIRGKSRYLAGQKSDALVEFIDLVPTATQALGFNLHPDFQGKPLNSLLQGKTTSHRDHVFGEFLQDDKAMVADQEWKYIFTTGKYDLDLGYATGHGPSGIYHRLYNISEDPDETTNLAYQEKYKNKVFEMQDIMLNKFNQTHPDADRLPLELNQTGQLVWFCQPRDIGSNYDEKPIRYFVPKGKEIPHQQQ
ncbi:MAG: sulfatase family protein [Candidatus Cyclobacteriaceae bacterium M3_2C_046]